MTKPVRRFYHSGRAGGQCKKTGIHLLDRPRAGGIVQGTNVKGAPGGTIRKVGSHVVRPTATVRAGGRIINDRQCEAWAGHHRFPQLPCGRRRDGRAQACEIMDGTPLGSPETWPDALKMVVSICLNSRFPISLWWGPELVMLYTDAWRPIFGKTKHPTWVRSVETGHPFVSEHRQRKRLLRPDADNDAMIGPGVVGQIPIGSKVAHAGTMEADPATIQFENCEMPRW
jgi:hypothetical protein